MSWHISTQRPHLMHLSLLMSIAWEDCSINHAALGSMDVGMEMSRQQPNRRGYSKDAANQVPYISEMEVNFTLWTKQACSQPRTSTMPTKARFAPATWQACSHCEVDRCPSIHIRRTPASRIVPVVEDVADPNLTGSRPPALAPCSTQ